MSLYSDESELYRCILISSFVDDFLLDFPIFIKSGKNYTLYKPSGGVFTRADAERLDRAGNKCIYLRSGDMEAFNERLEDKIDEIIHSTKLSRVKRAEMLFTVSANYVEEIYTRPKRLADNIDRCKHLIENIVTSCFNDEEIFGKVTRIVDHSNYEYIHATHVTTLSLVIAHLAFNLDRDEMRDLGMSAILHDMGKVHIDDGIVNKPGPLTDEEFMKMKEHTTLGYDYLKASTGLDETIICVARDHHEKVDGTGYPKGKKGDELGRNVRIVSLADVYCALISDRCYRKGYSSEDAIELMRKEFNTALDEKMFRSLTKYLSGVNSENPGDSGVDYLSDID